MILSSSQLFLTIDFQFERGICDQRHTQLHPCRCETQLCIYSLSKHEFSLYWPIKGKEKGRMQTLRGAEYSRRKLQLRQALGEMELTLLLPEELEAVRGKSYFLYHQPLWALHFSSQITPQIAPVAFPWLLTQPSLHSKETWNESFTTLEGTLSRKTFGIQHVWHMLHLARPGNLEGIKRCSFK